MKKLVSLLLALLFFFQALPVHVIAEAVNPVPTPQELSAAVALTGLSDEAPAYRSGMKPSDSMNAMQLAGWIHEFQKQKLGYIMDIFENYDVELAYVKEQYPVTFDMLKTFAETGIGKLYDEYSEAKGWRDDVKYYDDLLTSAAYRIDVLAEYLQSGELTEREQAIYAYEMRDKWRTLENIIPQIVERTEMWEAEYSRLETLLAGPYAYSGDPDSLTWLLDVVDNLRGTNGRKSSASFSVSASAVRVAPDQTIMTRLARLSPVSSALADSDQRMNVTIMDDKSFGIALRDGGNNVTGAQVSVNETGKREFKETTDSSGGVIFPVREFQNDSDGESLVNIRVAASGYRSLEAHGVWVKKGKALNVAMQKDDGAPYLVSWSFWDHDMLISKYSLITSPLNDSEQPIDLIVSSPADYHLKVYFTDKDGNNPVTVGEQDGKKGRQSYTFEGQWLMKAPVEGNLYAEITSKGKTYRYTANIELKASKLKKPLGDPNTKAVLNPGFQITLPKGWVKPFGGMSISIDLPIAEKYQLRGYFDIAGSGAFTIGTKLLEDVSKDFNNNWKTKDQKALDKAVKEVKGQGYLAETKAKNGGDWAGRSKWSPMKLGAISFDLSFFAFVQVQYTSDGYGYGMIFGKGGAGFTGTVKGSYTLMWPLAQLSASVALSVTVFPEIAVMVTTFFPSGADFPQFKKFEYVKSGINLIFRLEICLQALAGLKGIASISIRGIGYVEFAIRSSATVSLDDYIEAFKKGDLSQLGEPKKELTVYAGGSVDVVLEILWAKTTFPLLNPPLKFMLFPEQKQVKGNIPQNLVDRFIAAVLPSAKADEQDGPQEGGGQIDTKNNDLLIRGTLMQTWDTGTEKTEVFAMRPVNSEKTVPMMLYLQDGYRDQSVQYDRPILVSTPLNTIHYVPIACQNTTILAEKDHYMPDDGYDVIDFDYFVSDVSNAGLTTKSGKKINDVLFTVCILARDYENQFRILDDGTREDKLLPVQTWAYVRCFYLEQGSSGNWLEPLYLPGQENYVAECFDLDTYYKNNPNAYPRINGAIDRNRNGKMVVIYWVFTQPVNIQANKSTGSVLLLRMFSPDAPEMGSATINTLLERYESYFRGRKIGGLHFFRSYNDITTINYLGSNVYNSFYVMNQNEREDDCLFDLAYTMEEYKTIRTVAKNVVSFAARGYDLATRNYHTAFFVQQTEDGEGFRLMSVVPVNTDENFQWKVMDYDIPMPRTDIQWADLYGHECLYWVEAAGETEDGRASLFRARGMWYDPSSDSFSEPFAIVTLKMPDTDSYPTRLFLADDNEGFYFTKNDSGMDQLYRFDFKLVPGLKLVGNVLTETLPQPGSYDDMLLSVYNNGNIPIAGMDLNVYHEQNGKAAEVFETIHLDLIHPDRNSVVVKKGLNGATETRWGETVARQEPCSLSFSDEDYRYIRQSICKGAGTSTIRVLEENQMLFTTNLLMPGKYAAFNISLQIPQTWEGSHSIYLEVDRYYVSESSSFQQDVNGSKTARGGLLNAASEKVISIGRDGTVRRENSGGMFLMAARGEDTETAEDYSMYKTDLTFDRIKLDNHANDLSIEATRWDNNGEPMVTLTVTNWAHIGSDSRNKNAVVMEAYLDEETTPVFRYSLPDEVSDKETWNFDLPLSLLTDGRSASKVTVKIKGKNYKEVGDVDNSVVILLDTEALTFLTQPESQDVPAGSGASFYAAVIGGRTPYKYQWQMKAPKGDWTNLEGENADTLMLKAVELEMSGNQYRLTVTDASDYSVQSRAAELTVKKVPHTGDTAPLLWYIVGVAAAAAVIVYIMLKRKKEETK